MKELEEILLGGMFRPTEQNCPTREGELIGSLDKIHDIPNPRVGMRVYVENTGKEYIIKSLKDKTIGGVNVPNAAVGKFEEMVNREDLQEIFDEIATESTNRLNADNTIKASALKLEQSVNTTTDKVTIKGYSVDAKKEYSFEIPSATKEKAGVMSAEDKKKLDAAGNGATKITWGSASNMNDYRTAGVYDIYGERTRQDDNLPILNASSGHSIAARLTVVASTLQPANNEICVTQFLMLSNRLGGDGNMYVRTYNENNSPAADWWTPWQKLQGVREGYIFTDTIQVNPDGGVQQIEGVTGLNNMIDNGIYSGIYTDDPSFQAPTFIDTFTLIVINNYAVASKDSRLKRTISQLKYAVDAIANQATVKQRTKTDGSDWTDWQEIGGGGSNEVDITDAVKAYGLPTLLAQGFAKEGVTYKVLDFGENDPVTFDTENKIFNKLISSDIRGIEGHWDANIKIVNNKIVIDAYGYKEGSSGSSAAYYKFIVNQITNGIVVSADMTTL